MQLEIRGLTKRFGSFTANDDIDLTVEPGEIHCLLGENGAGKSTLMNMLYGLLTPDEGEILLDGESREFKSPADAIDAGIGMVHQHFMLVPVFTVAENVMLGHEQTGLPGVLDRRKATALVRDLSQRYGLSVQPDALVADISVGVQQRVEILKALIKDAQVLILDEPTAVLTPQETEELFTIMRQLRENGTSIVFITHKLREVREIADRITVIRRGSVVATADPQASEAELAELMVGRSVNLSADRSQNVEIGETVLDVTDLTVVDERGHTAVDAVSLDIRAGEVLGLAGVQGNGQTEFVSALFGLLEPASGSITLSGTDVTAYGPKETLRAGIGYVPEDRWHDGFVGSFSVAENLILDLYRDADYASRAQLHRDRIQANALQRIEEFDIRTRGPDERVAALSGGNQQKVVLARELSRPLRLLVASQPTRGLDVGSIEFVHQRILAARSEGTAVLIVSTELDEIAELSDRIAVICGGKIVGIVPADTPREELGLMMAGATSQEAKQHDG